jgi:hypothetical protein
LSLGARYRARAGPWAQAIGAIGALAALAAPARAGPTLETAIKATYLYKFAPFVEWPDASAPDTPFVLCVVGSDPFGPMIDQAVRGQNVDAHPIVVKRLDAAQKTSGCQIMYLGGSSAQSVADAVKAVRGAPVLTVAEGQGAGAVIGFVVKDQRVRFVVDIHAAAENNLKVSSKLLSLALEVQPGKP